MVAQDCFAFLTIHVRLRQLTTISAGASMLPDNLRRFSFKNNWDKLCYKNPWVSSHIFPLWGLRLNKVCFNFLLLVRVFSEKKTDFILRDNLTKHPVVKSQLYIFIIMKQLLLLNTLFKMLFLFWISENFMQFNYVLFFDFDCRSFFQDLCWKGLSKA